MFVIFLFTFVSLYDILFIKYSFNAGQLCGFKYNCLQNYDNKGDYSP